MTKARPVLGKSFFSNSLPAGSPLSTAEIARAMARRSPAKIFSAHSCCRSTMVIEAPKGALQSSQQFPGDNHPLDFAGTLANGKQLNVSVILLHRIILDKAVASVDLHRLVGNSHRQFGSKKLGHGRLASHADAAVGQGRSPVSQQPCGIDFCSHIHQFPLDGLERADRFSELFPLSGVTRRSLKGALRKPDRNRPDTDAAEIQYLEAIDKPVALL